MCSTIGIFFASSGGRTRRVAGLLAEKLGGRAQVEAHDLREAVVADICNWDLLIFGSPTYGIGDLHPKWKEWQDAFATQELRLEGVEVAVFALGDYQHHCRTFGDAIWKLDAIRSALGAQAIGQTYSDIDTKQRTPGLLLDAVSRRNSIGIELERWTHQLLSDSKVAQ